GPRPRRWRRSGRRRWWPPPPSRPLLLLLGPPRPQPRWHLLLHPGPQPRDHAPHPLLVGEPLDVVEMGREHLPQLPVAGGVVVAAPALGTFGGAHAVADLTGPLHLPLVGGHPRGRR